MNNFQQPFHGYIESFARALQDEIEAQSSLHQVIGAPWGKWLYSNGTQHVYQFRTDEALREPTDSYLQLLWPHAQSSSPVRGQLLAARGLNVQISFDRYLGEEIYRARVCFESSNLSRSLLTTLEQLDQSETFHWQLANHLFSPLADESVAKKENLFEQLKQVKRLFIWGPAGTGKTYTLTHLAKQLFLEGNRLLITGNTHRSIDNAFFRLIQLFQSDPDFQTDLQGKILRYGLLENHGENFNLLKSPASPEEWIRYAHADLYERSLVYALKYKTAKDQWEEWRRNRSNTSIQDKQNRKNHRRKMLEHESDLLAVNQKIKTALQEGVRHVPVLGCTMAQVFLNENIWQREFDYVIVDEASMVNLPNLFLAAGLARKGVVILGDFRQLPPISMGRTAQAKSWLARDIFEFVGIPEWVESKQSDLPRLDAHPEIHILKQQRRMKPSISNLSSTVFYHGLIKNEISTEAENSGGNDQTPEIILYDTSQASPWCTRRGKGEGKSRINLYHACVAVQLAERCLAKWHVMSRKGVGIITPYREQAKLIQEMLEDRGMNEQVQVATIHQFQGEERDVIIWDTVDTIGFPVSRLLQGKLGSGAARVTNVAITRARNHFFMIADVAYLKKNLDKDASLKKILNLLHEKNIPVSDARKILAPSPDHFNIFRNDLKTAEKSIVISSPLLFGPLNPSLQDQLLQLSSKDGVQILIDTLAPKLQREYLKEKFCGPPKLLVEEGIVTICHDFPEWKNFTNPHLILIDDRICWFASSPLLSLHQEKKEEQCFRITGRKVIDNLNMFFGLGLLQNAPHLHLSCPLCAGAMVLMWNRRKFGSAVEFYASCSEGCGYSRPLLRGERKESPTQQIRVPGRPRKKSVQKNLPGFLVSSNQDEFKPKWVSKELKAENKKNIFDPCPDCGKQTCLRMNPDRYLFVGCSSFPNCSFKRPYQEPCTSCEGQLVVRRSKHGIFLGCVNYPQCKKTKDAPKPRKTPDRDFLSI